MFFFFILQRVHRQTQISVQHKWILRAVTCGSKQALVRSSQQRVDLEQVQLYCHLVLLPKDVDAVKSRQNRNNSKQAKDDSDFRGEALL